MISAIPHLPALAQSLPPASHSELGVWIACAAGIIFALERGTALWQRWIGAGSYATRAEIEKIDQRLQKMQEDATQNYNALMTSEARGRSVLHEKFNEVSAMASNLNGKLEVLLKLLPGTSRRMPKIEAPAAAATDANHP